MSNVPTLTYTGWFYQGKEDGWDIVTIATSKKNPKPVVLGDLNGMRGHIDAVSHKDFVLAGWHRVQLCHLFP